MWEPKLSPKQRQLYLDPRRFLLAIGPRGCGKSVAVEHTVLRHAWLTNPCRIAIITKTTRIGTLGIWSELTTTIYQQWVDAGIGSLEADFGWAVTPRQNAVTKVHFAKLFNRYGGQSEIVLFPVERSEDAVGKLLSTQFSMIWLSEAHLYDSRALFDTSLLQLRLMGLKASQMKVICDANYPIQRKLHWLYQLFYTERFLEPDEYAEHWDEQTKADFAQRQAQLGVYEFDPKDNPFIEPALLGSFRATYASDPDLFSRLVLGGADAWTGDAVIGNCFTAVWNKTLHVIGDATGKDESHWEVMVASDRPHATRMGGIPLILGGWDTGDVNHAWVAIQPWVDDKAFTCFDVIEECVFIDAHISLETFTLEVLERMERVRKDAGFPVCWEHYSDSSVERFRASSRKEAETVVRGASGVPVDPEMTDAGIVYSSSKGKIELVGAAAVKKPGWQKRRVGLIQQLLLNNRIRVSAHCFETIRMFSELRVNVGGSRGTYLAGDQRAKHSFDALSYAISMHVLADLNAPPEPRTRVRMISA